MRRIWTEQTPTFDVALSTSAAVLKVIHCTAVVHLDIAINREKPLPQDALKEDAGGCEERKLAGSRWVVQHRTRHTLHPQEDA